MMKEIRQNLSLDRLATYQIKVPGELDENWSDWTENVTSTVDNDSYGMPITTLTGVVDQATLHGLLRRLYSMGVPLISINHIEAK